MLTKDKAISKAKKLSDKKLTEAEVRAEYRKYRKDDKVFAECWPDKDYEFYEWCSGYLDYKHIKRKDK